MSRPQAEMLPASMTGLTLATERYRAAAQDPASTAEDVFIPLSEALAWACSLDEALGKLYGKDQDACGADPVAPHLKGLRFARNRCTHQLALVAQPTRQGLPMRLPAVLGIAIRWRPADDLPPADEPRFNKGVAEYSGWLAGQVADGTLQRVSDWLRAAPERFSALA